MNAERIMDWGKMMVVDIDESWSFSCWHQLDLVSMIYTPVCLRHLCFYSVVNSYSSSNLESSCLSAAGTATPVDGSGTILIASKASPNLRRDHFSRSCDGRTHSRSGDRSGMPILPSLFCFPELLKFSGKFMFQAPL